MDKNTRSGLFGGQIILERKHTLHLNFVCSLVVPIYIYYLDDSTRKRKMGLGDLWPPHSREDSKAGLCHFFYFAVTSASRVRRPPRLFSWITAICAVAVVQLQKCVRPPAAAMYCCGFLFCWCFAHCALQSHTIYLLILHSTRKVSLRGHHGSCRDCWRKSRRRRRRRSHSWYWWWWWWSLLEMLKAAQQLQSIQEVPAAHF